MRGINKVIIVGTIGKKPEVRYFPSGDAIANASVAVNEQWKDKQTGERKERTEWINVVFPGKLGEIAGQYLDKGSKVYIEGKFTTRKWDKDGQTHYSSEVRVQDLQMLDGKKESAAPSAREQQASGRTAAASSSDAPFEDDDIPFD